MLKFFLKMFLWRSRMQFWQICQFLLAKNPKNFISPSENKEKNLFTFLSQKIPLDTYRAVQTELPPNNRLQFRKVAAENPKKTNKKNVQTLVLNFFLWKGRMQFWQTCRYFFAESQKLSTKNPKTKTISLPKNICFHRMARLATYNAIPTDLPQIFRQNLEKTVRAPNKHGKFFPQNVLVEK